ncbi:protein singed wings 2 isoform X2 [Leptinotarsa decemlineata]|uniref:protein singed wings 2 isoform X2 n=1 Tax=Leptinotarsa decemlineata TaxID=7539 RepID=UPI003D309CE2
MLCAIFLKILYMVSTITGRPTEEFCIFDRDILKCKGNLPEVELQNVTILELSAYFKSELNLSYIVDKLPRVQNISVENGTIDSILSPKIPNSIKVLELRNLLITNISRTFLKQFPNIQVLNLEGNRLKELDLDLSHGDIRELYLINNPWNCSKNFDWFFRLDKSVVKDLNKLKCSESSYPGIRLVNIASYLKDIKENCTVSCDCSLEKVVVDPTSGKLYPIIMVNCSDRGLTELPQQIPRYTRILHLEGNYITNLKVLKTTNLYESLWDLYLDNNEIVSIYNLEGSHWLSHFRAFSLRGNKLSKIPSFAFDNALMKNRHMPDGLRLYLGGNPWRCDCLFIPSFQELVLQKYAQQIKDIHDVKCSYVEGDENSLLPIVDLSRSSVCRLSTEYSLQEGLDLLNAILASLIVFVLGKLVYDYYHFKKTGKLPWIVMKMP